jgi:hypothetical protein
LPRGAPDPFAPPCMRQRFSPLTAGDNAGLARVQALRNKPFEKRLLFLDHAMDVSYPFGRLGELVLCFRLGISKSSSLAGYRLASVSEGRAGLVKIAPKHPVTETPARSRHAWSGLFISARQAGEF